MQLGFIVTARSRENCPGLVVQVQALSQDSAPATVPVARAHLCCPLQQRSGHRGELQRGGKLVNTAWCFEASRKRAEQRGINRGALEDWEGPERGGFGGASSGRGALTARTVPLSGEDKEAWPEGLGSGSDRDQPREPIPSGTRPASIASPSQPGCLPGHPAHGPAHFEAPAAAEGCFLCLLFADDP